MYMSNTRENLILSIKKKKKKKNKQTNKQKENRKNSFNYVNL